MRFLVVTLLLSLGCNLAHADDLSDAYNAIRAEATALAGEPLDMPRRATILYDIYQDSGGNHAFPLVALHGALWGYNFFEITGPIGDKIVHKYFYNKKEMAKRKAMLHAFSLSFQETNRSVFIDTYTNYYFTKKFGNDPEASHFVYPELLAALNRIHQAASQHEQFSPEEKKSIFSTALYYEQELTVGPAVRAAVDAFHWPFLKFFALKPVVHFAFFPHGTDFLFHDFSNQQERIEKATEAYDVAASVGFEKLEPAMRNYGVIPDAFFDDPSDYVTSLKAQILAKQYLTILLY